MRKKTEELLNLLLWTCERLTRPTFRNLTESWEGWAYRNGLLHQLDRLTSQRLIEARKSGRSKQAPVWRLSEAGRIHALGGRDPVKEWARSWDDRWRLVIFDVPIQQNLVRDRIRRKLRARGFGLLQESVWVTPHSLPAESEWLPDPGTKGSVLFLESEPCEGYKHEDVVNVAWDFVRINQLYSDYLAVLGDQPTGPISDEVSANAMRAWGKREHRAWLDAVAADPLLPERLLPPGYLGKIAWSARAAALNTAARSAVGSPPVNLAIPPNRSALARNPARRRRKRRPSGNL